MKKAVRLVINLVVQSRHGKELNMISKIIQVAYGIYAKKTGKVRIKWRGNLCWLVSELVSAPEPSHVAFAGAGAISPFFVKYDESSTTQPWNLDQRGIETCADQLHSTHSYPCNFVTQLWTAKTNQNIFATLQCGWNCRMKGCVFLAHKFARMVCVW